VRGAYHNKREKLSSLLFDLAKYLSTVIGVGAILPESKISVGNLLIGVSLAVVILVAAVIITPEQRA
jgi:hypothetical protein